MPRHPEPTPTPGRPAIETAAAIIAQSLIDYPRQPARAARAALTHPDLKDALTPNERRIIAAFTTRRPSGTRPRPRDLQYRFRLTEAEKTNLFAAAHACGLNVPDFIRQRCAVNPPAAKPTPKRP